MLTALALALVLTMGTGIQADAQSMGTVIYDFGGYKIPDGRTQQFAVNAAMLTGLLAKNADGTYALDAAGKFYADDNLTATFVAALAAIYDVPGTNTLNQEVEKQYLKAIIASGASDPAHKPTMTVVQAAPANAVGTYIMVDISDQKLYYYKDGVLSLTSDIVTGNTSLGHDTPTGVFVVYARQANRILKGQGYAAHVDYWMPFYKGYGMHDASWRKAFGGTIYQTAGSHGCVNIPKQNAALLFASVTVGTPVIIQQ